MLDGMPHIVKVMLKQSLVWHHWFYWFSLTSIKYFLAFFMFLAIVKDV